MQITNDLRLNRLDSLNRNLKANRNEGQQFDSEAIDPDQLALLLESISQAAALEIEPDELKKLKADLAKSGAEIQAPEVLNLLAAGLSSGKINQDSLAASGSLIKNLQELPVAKQAEAGDQLLQKATELLKQAVNDKNLTSPQILTTNQFLAGVQELQTATRDQQISANVANKDTQVNYTSNGTVATVTVPSSVIVAGMYPASAPAINLVMPGCNFDLSAFLADNSANMDSVMLAIVVLLSYINNVQTPALQNLNNTYLTMQNNIGAVTGGQNCLSEVSQFMAANTTATPVTGVNVFAALDLALNPAPSSAIIPANQQNFYQAFIASCPSFMTALTTAYNQYTATAGANSESLDQIAAGDSVDTKSGITFSAQSQIMAFFIAPINNAGFNIAGVTSNPIFTNDWTNGSVAGVEGVDPTSLYVKADQPTDAAAANLSFGSQLTFSATTISQYVGSGGTGQSGTSALGMMSQTLSTAALSNNNIDLQIQYLAQSISSLWTLIGQQLIPNEKLPIMNV